MHAELRIDADFASALGTCFHSSCTTGGFRFRRDALQFVCDIGSFFGDCIEVGHHLLTARQKGGVGFDRFYHAFAQSGAGIFPTTIDFALLKTQIRAIGHASRGGGALIEHIASCSRALVEHIVQIVHKAHASPPS